MQSTYIFGYRGRIIAVEFRFGDGKRMKRSSISNAFSLVLGVLLFFVGLLMLLKQENTVAFFSALFPNTQSMELAGAVFQVLGGLLVLNGAVRFLTSQAQSRDRENQALIYGLMQRVSSVEKRAAEVAGRVVSLEKVRAVRDSLPESVKCRFCGAGIELGSSFCSNCGRSNK